MGDRRACGFKTGGVFQLTFPRQLAAYSAEAQESALQGAQSERNVIALPRESRTGMQFRKGAAYWSPSAARLAERRS